MPLAMPRLDGIAATQSILEARPQTKVVVLTAFSERARILGALDAGAVGYLLKDASPDDLFGAVRAAARGESPLAPKADIGPGTPSTSTHAVSNQRPRV